MAGALILSIYARPGLAQGRYVAHRGTTPVLSLLPSLSKLFLLPFAPLS